MWNYEKRLQYPVNIKEPNAKLAQAIISQYGGPDGEMGASMRYLSQRYAMPYREVAGVLTDIGTEELAHLEMVATIVHQLTRNLSMEEIEKSGFANYYVDHTIGVWPQAAGGVPFNACEFQVKGDIITDLTEDMAADANVFKVQCTIGGDSEMQKLKNAVFEKMLVSNLTKAEVDFLLELSHYQDDKGRVQGIYYKNICDAIAISYETFYVTLNSLEQKGVLQRKKACYGDYDVVIVGNDCSYPGALQEGYINTGLDLFFDKSFKQLKAGEKLLAMQFIKIAGTGGAYRISLEVFYEKYSKIFQVTKRTIQTYLTKLKKFFFITLKNKLYIFKPKETCKYNAPTDVELYSEHCAKVACRRNRVKVLLNAQYKDTRDLVKQYCNDKFSVAEVAEAFLIAVQRSIELRNKHIPNKYKWDRHLNSKFIHKLMRGILIPNSSMQG